MERGSALLGVTLALSLTAALPSHAEAPNQREQTHQDNRNRDPYKYPPPVDHAASAQARKDIADAQGAINRAEASLRTIAQNLRKELEKKPEYTSAQADLAQAQADYEAAKAPVLEALNSKPEYQAARAKKEKAEAEREKLGDARTSQEYLDASTAVLRAGSEMTKLEAAALAADPAASQTRARLTQANTRLNELSRQVGESIQSDPKWQAARKALDDNKAKLAAAHAALPAAQQNEAAAEAQRSQKVAEIEQRKAAAARARAARNARRHR